jgi:hypothetical protein
VSASSPPSRKRKPGGRAARPERFGCEQPRVFTPPLRRLTPKTSLGFAVVEFARDVLGLELLPWQQWLLIHALELRTDGSLRYRYIVVLVARQNGKSTLSQVLALWFMYVYGANLVIGTAQDLDVAEEIWQGAVDMVEETPELDALKERVVLVNGKKSLELKTGERYKVKAANRRAGRGLSGELVLLDELREHQSWDAWGAVTKTTMARDQAQIWALSNAGDVSSIVLRYLRLKAHAALGDPDGIVDPKDLAVDQEDDDVDELEDDDTLGIFEWSAKPGCSIRDRDGWAQANPSLGYTITERTIAAAARTDPEWVFRTEVLCQWPDGAIEGPFPAGAWESCGDVKSKITDESPIAFCVDVSWDRTWTWIAAAGFREDDVPHVELVAGRAGTEWVTGWFTDPEHPDRAEIPIAVQARGAPSSSLLEQLEAEDLDVEPWQGADVGAACGAFYDRVRAAVGEGSGDGALKHIDQDALNVAAATATTRPIGDAWAWDRRKSPADAAPLVAATGALWLLMRLDVEPDVSVYEDRGLERV